MSQKSRNYKPYVETIQRVHMRKDKMILIVKTLPYNLTVNRPSRTHKISALATAYERFCKGAGIHQYVGTEYLTDFAKEQIVTYPDAKVLRSERMEIRAPGEGRILWYMKDVVCEVYLYTNTDYDRDFVADLLACHSAPICFMKILASTETMEVAEQHRTYGKIYGISNP